MTGPEPDVRPRTCFVLCHPTDPRNVGGAIRAVVNHGIAGLRIVGARFDPEDLFHFSSESVTRCDLSFFDDLESAVADCGRIIGTSRRPRDPLAPPAWPAAGLARRLVGQKPVAVLFGTERTGLTREEVDRCEALVWMPTSEAFPSMNLSHAVACVGYELARPAETEVGPPVAAEADARCPPKHREAFYAHVHEVSAELGYPPGRNPDAFTRRVRRILTRANPNAAEYGLLAGVFTELRRLARLARERGD